ncbi:hypothetical protein L6E12_24035 [Actinokineospora sp. PR83]|uniref:hypothetical protein n=1 Tax=Actinokineospora sp. PR83 TaxID=2884908 RepID=UPI001F1E404C|nr:hypothetical protein [Actinokineospora sp. PR83]MCG8918853.1 hypothetical protein [Actinokineospora sp. PR83]
MDTTATLQHPSSTTFDFSSDEPIGACLCPEFAHGRRELHITGQPGCVDEVRAN